MRRSTTTDRNALAEIRQSYLLRQSITGNRYKNYKNPYFNIKPDNYDYRFSDFRNYFAPERPALPYYVVPVLYVPQKVLTTDEIDNKRRKNETSQTPESFKYPDYEYREEDEVKTDFGSKSADSCTPRTNSETTVEISSISTPIEEVEHSTFKTNRFKRDYLENKYSINEDAETIKSDFKKDSLREQKKTFWKYKNPYTIFNKYPNESKISSHDENDDLESEDDKKKQKICMDCLKDKYLNKDVKDVRGKRNFQIDSGDELYKSRNYADTKSTQTLTVVKINSGTQTEVETKLPYRKMKGSQIPQRTNGLKVSYTELVKGNGNFYGNANNVRRDLKN